MVTNSEVVVLVQKVGRGQWIAVDPNGADHASDIPVHALRKVADTDQVLHRITTKAGKIQWRAKDFENFRYLLTYPLHYVNNFDPMVFDALPHIHLRESELL